jgi:hypothetical protein
MKYFLRYLFLLPVYSFAQTEVYNTDLFDSTKRQLFQFDQNELFIRSPYNIDKIEFVNSKSNFSSLHNGRFRVYVYRSGSDSIKLYSKGKLVYISPFQIDTVGNPVARVGYYVDTLLSLNQILLNPCLNVLFPGTNYRGRYFIFHFTMTIEYLSGVVSPTEATDFNRFSTRQLEAIKTLQPGDQLHFTYVAGGGPDGRIRKLPPFTITIK